MIYYHFTGNTLRHGSQIPPIGEWLSLPDDRPIVPCEWGLHASPDPFSALEYAPGPLLHQVELDGDITPHGTPINKYAARRRKIIATIDATDVFLKFNRYCALSVAHLWEAPQIVVEYLRDGDEAKRSAALHAIRDEGRDIVRYVGGIAAWDAARYAMEDVSADVTREVVQHTVWASGRCTAWSPALAFPIAEATNVAITRYGQYFNTLVEIEFSKPK